MDKAFEDFWNANTSNPNSSNPNPNTNMFGFSSYQSGSGFDAFSATNFESPQFSSPPFSGSHFSSPSPGLEGINLNDSFDDKGSYIDAETMCLVRTWVDLSTDAIVKNSQKDAAYWRKIVTRYYEIIPDSRRRREKQALKCHWQQVSAAVKKFHDYYLNHEKMWQNGLSDRDIIHRAHMEYKQNEGKMFKMEAVWEILKNCPKFWEVEASTKSSKKGKNNAGEGFSSEASIPTDAEAPSPIGNKRAIAKRKGKKKKEHVPAVSKHVVGKLDVIFGKIDKGTSTMEEMTSKFSQRFEYDVMTRKTSDMDPEQLAIHMAIVAKLKQKWGIE